MITNWDYMGGDEQYAVWFYRYQVADLPPQLIEKIESCWRRVLVLDKKKKIISFEGSPGFSDRECTKPIVPVEEFAVWDISWRRKMGIN